MTLSTIKTKNAIKNLVENNPDIQINPDIEETFDDYYVDDLIHCKLTVENGLTIENMALITPEYIEERL